MIKVLLIDDDESFCMVTKSMLNEIGYHDVAIAMSGTDGLHVAKKVQPDVIILDIEMPGINGLVVLSMLKNKRKTKDIPVIMLTGTDDQDAIGTALSQYAQEYIIKPVTVDSLQSAIERAFYSRPETLA